MTEAKATPVSLADLPEDHRVFRGPAGDMMRMRRERILAQRAAEAEAAEPAPEPEAE